MTGGALRRALACAAVILLSAPVSLLAQSGAITFAPDGPVVIRSSDGLGGGSAPMGPAAPFAQGSGPAGPGLIRLPRGEEPVAGPDGASGIPNAPPGGVLLPSAPSRDRGAAAAGPEGAEAMTEGLMPLVPLHRFPAEHGAGATLAGTGVLRLTGERVVLPMTFYLPDGAPLPKKLILTLQSSVNVLPDSARLQLQINDAPAQSLVLDSIGAFTTLEVSAEGLTHGENRVQFDIRQPHRIWCGPDATFGVWTEIDLTRSGAQVPLSAITPDPSGFALALRAQIGTGRPLPVLSMQAADPVILRQVTDQISAVMGGNGQITLRSFYAPGPKAYASVALIASDKNHVSFRPGSSGALVMQIEHRPGELPDLAPHLPPAPPAEADARLTTPGRPVTLAELGFEDLIGNTHYFRHDINFRLPEGWLLLANQRARLQLHYGFAAGLAQDSILMVKVNGETVRILPLNRNGGEVQPPLDINFPARLLHGGVNSLTFEMMVPGEPSDAPCLPRPGDMLVILNESTLNVPPSPPMELAGITRPLSGLTSAGVIAAEGSDPASMPLIAARIAAGIARPLRADPNVRLYITDINSPGALPAGPLRLSLRKLQQALFPPTHATASLASGPKGTADSAAAAPARPAFTLDRGPQDDTAPPEPEISPGDDAPRAVSDWLAEHFAGAIDTTALFASLEQYVRENAYIGSTETLETWLGARQGVALLMRPDSRLHNELWLILGPRPPVDMIAQSLSDLRRSRLGSGEAALLRADGTWEVWTPITPPTLLDKPRLSEWRSVLGNFASWSPLIYTGMTLLVALISVLPAFAFVMMTRTTRGGRQ